MTREQRVRLDALLVAGEGGQPSPLDRLRDGPYLRSALNCPVPSVGSMKSGY